MAINLDNLSKDFIIKNKNLIQKKDYYNLIKNLFSKAYLEDSGFGINISVWSSMQRSVLTFLYEDCNINFLQYLKFSSIYDINRIIKYIDTRIITIPENIVPDCLEFSDSVEEVIIEINPRLTNVVTFDEIYSNNLKVLRLTSKQLCDISLYLNSDVLRSLKEIYIDSKIKSLAIEVRNETDLYEKNIIIHVDQSARIVPLKVTKFTKQNFNFDMITTLQESFQKNIPKWLQEYLKDNEKRLTSEGIDLAGHFTEISIDDDELMTEMSTTGTFSNDSRFAYPNYVFFRLPAINNTYSSIDHIVYCPQLMRNQYADPSFIEYLDYIQNKQSYNIPELREFLKTNSSYTTRWGFIPEDIIIAILGSDGEDTQCIYYAESTIKDKKNKRNNKNINKLDDYNQGKLRQSEVPKEWLSLTNAIRDKSGYIIKTIRQKIEDYLSNALISEKYERIVNFASKKLERAHKRFKQFLIVNSEVCSPENACNILNATLAFKNLLTTYQELVEIVTDKGPMHSGDLDVNRSRLLNFYDKLDNNIAILYTTIDKFEFEEV